VLVTAAVTLALAGAGHGTAGFIGFRRNPPLPFAAGLGLGLGTLTVFGFGLAGLLFPAVAIATVFAGLFMLVRNREAFLGSATRMAGSIVPVTREARWLVAIAAVAGIASLVMALGPEGGWDPRYYHLRLPKLYALRHGIFLVPYVYPSHYPQTVEMLYTLGWLMGGEQTAKVLNWALWPIAGAALFNLALPRGSRTAFRSVALALTMPVTAVLAAENYIDLGLTLFVLLALDSALAGRFVVAGLFAGFAMGSKYTGVIAALALVGPLVARRRAILPIAVAGLVSAVPVIPWLARNWLFTGNPVAPFFHHLLGAGILAGFSQSDAEKVIPGLVPTGPLAALENAAGAPWRFLRTAHFAVFSPFMLGLAPAIVPRSRSPREKGLKVWVLLFSAGMLLLAPDGRYWHPAAFPLALLVVMAWERLAGEGVAARRVFGAFAWASLAFCAAYHVLDMHRTLPAVPLVSAGLLDRDEYLVRTRHPRGYVGAIAKVNLAVPAGERVAVLGATEAYLFDSEALFDCDAPGSRRWLYLTALRFTNEAGFARWFRQRNIRTVFYVPARAAAGAEGEAWPLASARPWARFWNSRAHIASTDADCLTYVLARAPGTPSPQRDLPGPQDALLAAMDAEKKWSGRTRIYTVAVGQGLESAHLDAVYGAWTGNDGRYPQAEAALRRALRISPSHAPAWYWLAAVRLGRKNPAGAREALERGVDADPGFILRVPLEMAVERALKPKAR